MSEEQRIIAMMFTIIGLVLGAMLNQGFMYLCRLPKGDLWYEIKDFIVNGTVLLLIIFTGLCAFNGFINFIRWLFV